MKHKIVFFLILILAVVLRFYQLGELPSGLTWDEAAIGYNAYGIATVHRDEWLLRTPITFRSFGDYKSPLGIYAAAVLMLFAKPSELLVRLPVTIAGTGLVVMAYLLAKHIGKEIGLSSQKQTIYSLFVMFLVAISPWAIHYSRIGFESMIAAFLVSLGVYGWLRAKEDGRWYILSIVPFVLALYAYHSAKVVVPFFSLVLFGIGITSIRKQLRWFLIALLLGTIVAAPLLYATFFGKANDRALSTTIFGKPNVVSTFVSNVITQMSPSYLLYGNDITYRHSTKEVGILYPFELLFALLGIMVIGAQKKYRTLWWIPAFFGISILPAALGTDVPHSNRALLGLPWVQVLAGIGMITVVFPSVVHTKVPNHIASLLEEKRYIVAGGVVVLFLLNLSSYWLAYTRTYSSSTALREFGYGYSDLIAFTRKKESEVSKVYFTNSYGQAYIYLLFYKQMNPIDYRGGGLANYTITDKPFEEAHGQKNVLIVGTDEQIPDDQSIIFEVKYPDGNVAFQVVQQ